MRNRIDRWQKFLAHVFYICFVTTTVAGATPGESVVRIKVQHANGSSVGSGFVWSDPKFVVTALHVVAGARKITIYSENEKKSSSAKIHTALLEPDLALLKLDRDIGLVPLQTAEGNPNSTDAHFIWGYPHDVSEMTRHKIEMVGGLSSSPNLASIFKNQKQLKNTIGDQGYPSLDAKIFRITKIQPGHSGAPIFDKSGYVIGIGDGGLRDGLAGLNWAIPASIYLPDLKNSSDPIPGQSSAQASLFNVPIDEKPIVFSETSDHILRRVWRAPLVKIIESMEQKRLQKEYTDLDALTKDETGRSLAEAIVDVYEDEETGATFAVPKNFSFRYDTENKLLIASARTGSEMMIQATNNDSWDQGVVRMEGFNKFLNNIGINWQKDPKWPDTSEIDTEDSYAYYEIYRIVPDNYDEDPWPQAELDAVLLIDDNDFLGTAVITRNVNSFSEQDWYNHYLLMMCVNLVDFADYQIE